MVLSSIVVDLTGIIGILVRKDLPKNRVWELVAAKMLINIKSIEDKNKEVTPETPIQGDRNVNSQKDRKLQMQCGGMNRRFQVWE